jgi:hypothetical protein
VFKRAKKVHILDRGATDRLGRYLENNKTEALDAVHDFLMENDLQQKESVKSKELHIRQDWHNVHGIVFSDNS